MQRNINSLIGYNMEGTDGKIGTVEDFFFDDDTSTIRYLIVKTGSWFFGKKVLISPNALIEPLWKSELFPVNLTKEQIKNSPDVDTDRPVSRQQEVQLHGYYPWQSYWGQGYNAGGVWGTIYPAPLIENKEEEAKEKDDMDVHLRSTKELEGYYINATDGEIGHVKDFVIDDATWKLLYLVIDTHNWIGGRRVLLSVEHIKRVQWLDNKIFVNVSIEAIKDAPRFIEDKYSLLKASNSLNVFAD